MKIFFLLSFLFFQAEAVAQTLPTRSSTLLKKSYRMELKSRYFQSHSTVSSEGAERLWPKGKYFTRWDNDIGLSYGFNDRLESSIGMRYRYNHSGNTLLSSQGIESIWFQAKYRIPLSHRFQLTADTRFQQTVYSEKNGDIILGDPGQESEWGIHLTWLVNKKNSWSLYTGYRRPPNQLSEEIHYLLEYLWQKKGLGLGVGLDGVVSLQTDPYITESARPKSSTGGTRHYNSFNQEWMRPYVSLHYVLSPHWRIHFEASQVVRALSGDKGTVLGLKVSRTSKGVTATQKKIEKFKEYNIEANVTKVSKKQHFVQIDRGMDADILKGMKFDIYQVGLMKENELLASGVAWEIASNKSVIRIFKRYSDKKIKPGTIARGY